MMAVPGVRQLEVLEKLRREKMEARKVEADKQEQIDRLRKETHARKRSGRLCCVRVRVCVCVCVCV